MDSLETVRHLVAKCGRKRSRNSNLREEPPHKKSADDASFPIPFLNLPFMIRVQICSYLDLDHQKILWESCAEGKETVLHFWRAQRNLNLSPAALKMLFPALRDCTRFESVFSLRSHVLQLFAWIRKSALLRELDLRGIRTVNWALLETIVHDEHGSGVMADTFKKVSTLRLEGCYLSSDDIHNAGIVLPNLEVITLSDRSFTIYEDADGNLPKNEVRGRMNKKRTTITKLLKHCFPRLRVIKFY